MGSESSSRTTAVVTSTVDFIEYAPLRDIETLEADDSLVMAGDANTNIRFIAFNLEREPFNNPLVRIFWAGFSFQHRRVVRHLLVQAGRRANAASS